MTKFEEEVKRPDNVPITELNNSMQSVLSQYRKMREYADYLEYELKQKDEHILKLENENSFMRDERTTFDSNGNSVEPIIPQQALPVVPEFVGEFIDESKGNLSLYGALFFIRDNTNKELNNWIFREANQNLFARAWLDGYQVEKPQLFYLENKLTGMYLYKKVLRGYGEEPTSSIKYLTDDFKFTQPEIDSMETGSYEQIEVTE